MIDKQLLKQRFCNAKSTYVAHAKVQADMARQLVKLALPYVSTANKSMLELGCGIGLLTEEILRATSTNSYVANDLVPCTDAYIQQIVDDHQQQNFSFLSGDIEQLNFHAGQDVIWSGATIQWIQDLKRFFQKMSQTLNDEGLLVLSSFGPENYCQIKSITGYGINYPDILEVMQMASAHFKVLDYKEWQQELWFNSPRAILKHMRYTGVNGTNHCKWTKGDLQNFITKYEAYMDDDEYPLTYHPFLLVFKKNRI